jgi:A nuclease of the HNH/ENDO VII superfamily with conserved WHH
MRRQERGLSSFLPAGFSTRTNPGLVWHCACDDEGKANMEFVKYEVHAAVTHTDGYSLLRAIKGLIKKGQTRLPE